MSASSRSSAGAQGCFGGSEAALTTSWAARPMINTAAMINTVTMIDCWEQAHPNLG
ncbi:hypothetical protein [Actinoplanes sp. HUAS TT8]|uniref:hypothetical protein n=1 Tax=Actinoplanes sp. HUAS TT8 TaxID=3447453 RepID=UPI003F52678D